MAEETEYHDVIIFHSHEVQGPEKEIVDRRTICQLYSFINNVTRKSGSEFLPVEIRKTQKDILIIEMVLRMVTEYMVLLGRSKIINISLPFIHLIPEGKTYSSNSVFGGIVVERVENDAVFAIKLFQKVFARMSFSAIKVCEEDRTIVYVDVGKDFKEAAASLISRDFFEEFIKKNSLFNESNPIVEEKCFDLRAEDVFNSELDDLWEKNRRIFPREKFFKDMVEATINGRILPLMLLRDHRVDTEEIREFLSWIS